MLIYLNIFFKYYNNNLKIKNKKKLILCELIHVIYINFWLGVYKVDNECKESQLFVFFIKLV